MTQLTLPPAAIAAIQANTPYAKVRRDACMRLAQRIAANPENYTVADLADAHAVLRPTVLGEEAHVVVFTLAANRESTVWIGATSGRLLRMETLVGGVLLEQRLVPTPGG